MQSRWGTHADHPAVVLAPSSAMECFDLMVGAFNISERFRMPVIVLYDEIVGHMREKVSLPSPDEIEVVNRLRPSVPPEWYIPYENTPSGVPPMGIFGDGYRYHVTGLTHDLRGFPTSRPDEVSVFISRLHRKIKQGLEHTQFADGFFTEEMDILVIAYGITARSAFKAVKDARLAGIRAGLLKLKTLWPFMERAVIATAAKAKTVVVPEMNIGQIAGEVERVVYKTHQKIRVIQVNRVDGTIITPEEILGAIQGQAR